jgi:hypothetical protein
MIIPRHLARWKALVLALTWSLFVVGAVGGQVERIEIERREIIADGRSFGLAGPYEKIVGIVHFALDPDDPGNAPVVDLAFALRDERGKVRYAADLYILKPLHSERGNGTALPLIPRARRIWAMAFSCAKASSWCGSAGSSTFRNDPSYCASTPLMPPPVRSPSRVWCEPITSFPRTPRFFLLGIAITWPIPWPNPRIGATF